MDNKNLPLLKIEGRDIYLEEFQEVHLYDTNYYSWLRNPDVMVSINRMEYLMPIQFKGVEEYVRGLWDSLNDAFFAIVHTEHNKFIGTLRLLKIDWRLGYAEIGIMIGDQKYWGQGLSKQAVSLACEYAFNKLCLRKIGASANANNHAMCKCFLRTGFKEEGILRKQAFVEGEYVDRVIFGILKDEFIPQHQ